MDSSSALQFNGGLCKTILVLIFCPLFKPNNIMKWNRNNWFPLRFKYYNAKEEHNFYFQGPHSYGVRTFFTWSISELLSFFWPTSNWLWQVMWNKNYWWHHSTLSTSLVTSVNVSWLRPRTPEVRSENYTWLTHLPQL